jgi:dTDP-4-dehydrorhamnose 3,5-epimerase
MKFIETRLKGAYIIEVEPIEDSRGFFARTFCSREFKAHGLKTDFVQCNLSYNKKKGTLRGMHYQVAPYEEAKLVSCIKGSIYDVIIDLRPESPTYCQWFSVVLTAPSSQFTAYRSPKDNLINSSTAHSSLLTAHSLYIPEGFAHGFITLEDDTEVFYQMGEFYHPEAARGIRYNDPRFNIQWPVEVEVISEKDRDYPDWVDEYKS